ncbi:Integrator complex subunit [Hibiscus syriacus]|uniref:Integrator complex subunit n=1 Tax=Hibiscus syriacus TaxID=106335 RepID=A0A6A3CMI2_HIBSY|nr:Integrator complex subunit [Hibiscus syriacus]
MEQEKGQDAPPSTSPTSTPPLLPPPPPSSSYALFLTIMSKRRTWVFLFVLVYAILLVSSWNSLKSILSWYKYQSRSSSPSSCWPALYASVLLGAVFGLLSMVAALAVAVPATLVTWITIVVLLAFFGKPKRTLVLEGRKITIEIASFVFKILLKEGNLVAAVCAVLGYFAFVRKNSGE